MTDKSFADKFIDIQQAYTATKTENNDFGGYHYRNIEKMLVPLKPLLKKHNMYITFDDDLVNMGDRYYVKATATITDGEHKEVASAFAREEYEKKKSDASQLTGSASTYARKYALQGLLGVDDGTNDPDSKDNDRKQYSKTTSSYPASSTAKPRYATMKQVELMINKVKWGLNIQDKDQILNFLDQVLDVELTKVTADSVDDALAKIDEAVRKEKVGDKIDQTVPEKDVIVEIPEGEFSLDGIPY